MSGNFKTLYKLDNAKDKAGLWEAGCPLMVEAFQLVRNTNTSESFLQVKVRNVCSEVIGNYELEARVEYEDGGEEKLTITEIDGDVPPGGTDQPSPMKLANPLAASAVVRVKGLSCGQGEKWERSASQDEEGELGRERLVLSDKAASERRAQIAEHGLPVEDLVYEVTTSGGSWRCSCGQPNINRETCSYCNSGKAFLLDVENEGDLEAKADERNLQVAATERDKRKQREQRKKKRIVAMVIGIAAVIAIAVGAFFVIDAQSFSEYQVAMDVKSKTQAYKEAAKRFEALGGYRDSAYQAEVCNALNRAKVAAWPGDGRVHFEDARDILEPYRGDEAVEKLLSSVEESALENLGNALETI